MSHPRVRMCVTSRTGASDEMRFRVEGRLEGDAARGSLRYAEPTEDGQATSDVSIAWDETGVHLTRAGAYALELHLHRLPEAWTPFAYRTPYGSLAMEACWVSDAQERDERGFLLELSYRLRMAQEELPPMHIRVEALDMA